jgi:hypothetical protein
LICARCARPLSSLSLSFSVSSACSLADLQSCSPTKTTTTRRCFSEIFLAHTKTASATSTCNFKRLGPGLASRTWGP